MQALTVAVERPATQIDRAIERQVGARERRPRQVQVGDRRPVKPHAPAGQHQLLQRQGRRPTCAVEIAADQAPRAHPGELHPGCQRELAGGERDVRAFGHVERAAQAAPRLELQPAALHVHCAGVAEDGIDGCGARAGGLAQGPRVDE